MADPIGDAAKKLTDAAYPLMKEVKWDSYVYNLKPGGSATAGDWAKAVDKAIEMGAAMDPKLLKAGVQALGGVCKRGEGCSTLAQIRDDCSHALSDVLALRF